MPDPRPDPELDRDNPRALLHSPYTYTEEERLEALSKPWPLRWFAYIAWLADAMNSTTGLALYGILIMGGVFLIAGAILGILALAEAGGGWIVALFVGIGIGIGGRVIWRDAVATELTYRQRIADKQRQQREREKDR